MQCSAKPWCDVASCWHVLEETPSVPRSCTAASEVRPCGPFSMLCLKGAAPGRPEPGDASPPRFGGCVFVPSLLSLGEQVGFAFGVCSS